IALALSELGDFIAMRGALAGACEHYDQEIAGASEVGAVEDDIGLRTRHVLLYWLLRDRAVSAAAIAEVAPCRGGDTWPAAWVALVLAAAELSRWGGDAGEARHRLGVAASLMGDDAEQANIRAGIHDKRGYLAGDLREARTLRVGAWQAASEAGHAFLIARVLVGGADLALRRGQYEQAGGPLPASGRARRPARPPP